MPKPSSVPEIPLQKGMSSRAQSPLMHTHIPCIIKRRGLQSTSFIRRNGEEKKIKIFKMLFERVTTSLRVLSQMKTFVTSPSQNYSTQVPDLLHIFSPLVHELRSLIFDVRALLLFVRWELKLKDAIN